MSAAEEGQWEERREELRQRVTQGRPESAFETERPDLEDKRDMKRAEVANARAKQVKSKGALPQPWAIPTTPKKELRSRTARELGKALLQRPGSALEFRRAKEEERHAPVATRWSLEDFDRDIEEGKRLPASQNPASYFGELQGKQAKSLVSAVDRGLAQGRTQGQAEREQREMDEMLRLEDMRNAVQHRSHDLLAANIREKERELSGLRTSLESLRGQQPSSRAVWNPRPGTSHLPLDSRLQERLKALDTAEHSHAASELERKQLKTLQERLSNEVVGAGRAVDELRREVAMLEDDHRSLLQTEQQSAQAQRRTEQDLQATRRDTLARASKVARGVENMRGSASIRQMAMEYEDVRALRQHEISAAINKRAVWREYSQRTRATGDARRGPATQEDLDELEHEFESLASAVGEREVGRILSRIIEVRAANERYHQRLQGASAEAKREERDQLRAELSRLESLASRGDAELSPAEQREERARLETAIDREELRSQQHEERTMELAKTARNAVASLGSFTSWLQSCFPAVSEPRETPIHRSGPDSSKLQHEEEEEELERRLSAELSRVESMLEKLLSLWRLAGADHLSQGEWYPGEESAINLAERKHNLRASPAPAPDYLASALSLDVAAADRDQIKRDRERVGRRGGDGSTKEAQQSASTSSSQVSRLRSALRSTRRSKYDYVPPSG